jgi:hypothetical protein
MWNDEIYSDYELLLPLRFDGGYLIITLYTKIKNKELGAYFSTEDIKLVLEEIAAYHNEGTSQSERIIKNLLHYFLRNVPDEYGKFYLTDYAIQLAELLEYKLNNPYKTYPLKESFDKYFTLRQNEIKTIQDLEIKFGREFVSGHKRIINNHIEALEDELTAAYEQLNTILSADEEDATSMVKKFTAVFKKFGERAEDITNAISSKDNFLRRLRLRTDEFYAQASDLKHAESEEDKSKLSKAQSDWKTATEINNDLSYFFKTVDTKINHIRKQILKASGKLTELQENFSRRSNFRLLLKKLFHLCLHNASNRNGVIQLHTNFPCKQIVCEKQQLFYPEYYDFELSTKNQLLSIPRDREYEEEQRREIEKEIKRQEIINFWIDESKKLLISQGALHLPALMDKIVEKEKDLAIAQNVAIELSQFAAENPNYKLEIIQQLQSLEHDNLYLWKMKIQKTKTTVF